MKKAVFLCATMLLMIGCSSPEQKAKNLIKNT